MSIVATRSTHRLELSIAHLNTMGRVIEGAYDISVMPGMIVIQGYAEDVAEVPEALGLSRCERLDHAMTGKAFRVWTGMTSSAFGSFETRVVMVEPLSVEIPADCDSASFN